ncbi:hypothetical protein QBC34DRAFT_430723 [Podospora aff. communis PSN243]|uniref:DUF1772-domain-containing protein n=1 Tax=Podospora aff. communis PSN243 TaxID=3040156 RepID=A0AAV9G6M2_9PEZI|nr:hypothetical protein QBC34DRAFT_430723 [Podospora aff. communis PSN243]
MSSTTTAVVGGTMACSFILLGNAITQSFMGVPALLVDFPPPTSPSHAAAARHLGRQWPTFWSVGNVFFRPISTLGILGYGFVAFSAYNNPYARRDWRFFAVSAFCHLVTVVHSAANMQPLNEKLDALSTVEGSEVKGKVDVSLAEWYARRWIRLNTVRIVMPLVAGGLALYQTLVGN